MDAGAGAKSATTSLARAKFAGTSPPSRRRIRYTATATARPRCRVSSASPSDAAANALEPNPRVVVVVVVGGVAPRVGGGAVPLDFARSHPRPATRSRTSRAASTACGASRARSQDVSSMRSTGGGASGTSQNLRRVLARTTDRDPRGRTRRAASSSSRDRPGRFGTDASAGTGVMTWRRWSAWMKGWPRAGSSSDRLERARRGARGGARARGDRRSRGLCRARRGYRDPNPPPRREMRRRACRTPRRTSSGRARRRRRRPPPSRGARSRRAGAGRNARRTRRSKDRAPCGATDEGDDGTVARDGRSGSTRARAETTIGAPRGAYRAREHQRRAATLATRVPFSPEREQKNNECDGRVGL